MPFAAEWNVHRCLCHQWCDKRLTWTTERNDIVFTDEYFFCLQHHDGWIRVWGHSGERMLNCCVMHRHTGPAPVIMVRRGIGLHYRTPLVRTLNRQRYVSEVLESVVLPYIQRLPSAIFQQDNARPHVARSVQGFFCTHQIEFLPWSACSSDLSPIENVWSMLAERQARDKPPAATLDQLWQYLEAAWTTVLEGYIQSLFDSTPRRVAAVIANNGGYTNY